MGKKGYSTCKGCGKLILKEESHIYSGKKYCNDCYDIKLQEKQDYNNLINYIMVLFEIDVPSGLILKQIKDYKDEFKYTINGIYYTLWYCKEIKNIKFDIKFGIALVKYEYENAECYFMQQQKIKNSIKAKKINIKQIQIEHRINDGCNLLIDIDSLIKDGD